MYIRGHQLILKPRDNSAVKAMFVSLSIFYPYQNAGLIMRYTGDGRQHSFRITTSLSRSHNFGDAGNGILTSQHYNDLPPVYDFQVYYSMLSFFSSLVARWTIDDPVCESGGEIYIWTRDIGTTVARPLLTTFR